MRLLNSARLCQQQQQKSEWIPAMTALVEATAGIIRFTTPDNIAEHHLPTHLKYVAALPWEIEC